MAPTTIDPIYTKESSGHAIITQGQAETTASAPATAAHCQGGGMRLRPSPITARASAGSLADGQIPPVAHQACATASRASTRERVVGRVMSETASYTASRGGASTN